MKTPRLTQDNSKMGYVKRSLSDVPVLTRVQIKDYLVSRKDEIRQGEPRQDRIR